MAHPDEGEEAEFVGRPTVQQSLELTRRMEKERSAIIWGRNLAGYLFVIAVVIAVIVLRT